MTESTAPRKIAPFIAVGIAVIGCLAVVLWKVGVFGTESNGRRAANGDTLPATARTNPNRSLQKLDQALDAVSTYIQSDQVEKADTILDALVEAYPTNPNVYRSIFEVRLYQQRNEDAYRAIRKVLELDGTSAEEQFNAGIVASMLGKIEPAAAHFELAASMDQANPKFPLYLAQMYIKLHEYDKAKVRLLQVINLNGSFHEAFGTLAEVALIENDLDMAKQHISRAREIAPTYLKWRLVEAKIERRRGNPEKSLALLNALDEERGRYRQDVVEEAARCLALMGEPSKAAAEFEKQLDKHPDAWLSAVRAAEYHLIAKNVDKARVWCTYARGLAPDAEEVQRLQQRLDAPSNSGG